MKNRKGGGFLANVQKAWGCRSQRAQLRAQVDATLLKEYVEGCQGLGWMHAFEGPELERTFERARVLASMKAANDAAKDERKTLPRADNVTMTNDCLKWREQYKTASKEDKRKIAEAYKRKCAKSTSDVQFPVGVNRLKNQNCEVYAVGSSKRADCLRRMNIGPQQVKERDELEMYNARRMMEMEEEEMAKSMFGGTRKRRKK